jgi:hypothetical protein
VDQEHQAFQVFAFGMVNAYRMIGRLGQLMKNGYFSPRLDSRSSNGMPEEFSIDYL